MIFLFLGVLIALVVAVFTGATAPEALCSLSLGLAIAYAGMGSFTFVTLVGPALRSRPALESFARARFDDVLWTISALMMNFAAPDLVTSSWGEWQHGLMILALILGGCLFLKDLWHTAALWLLGWDDYAEEYIPHVDFSRAVPNKGGW